MKDKTLVVVIDVQYGYLSSKGDASNKLGWNNSNSKSYLKRLKNFIKKIRKIQLNICFVRMEESRKTISKNLPKYNNKNFTELCKRGTKQHKLLIKPLKSEKVFEKVHYSAYSSKDFKKYTKNFSHIVFAGTLASRCVFSTMVSMSSNGFKCTLIDDLCVNPLNLSEEEKHFKHVSNMFAKVVSSRKYIKTETKA